MRVFKKLFLISMFLVLTGCTKYVITPLEGDNKYINYFEASIHLFNNPNPKAGALPKIHRRNKQALGFILKIKNKTNKELVVNWNKTLFINNGQTDGSFSLASDLCIDRNRQKISDVIFANSSLKKRIYPSHLVTGKCDSGVMGIGKFGVWLTVSIDGKEMQKKMMLEVKKDK